MVRHILFTLCCWALPAGWPGLAWATQGAAPAASAGATESLLQTESQAELYLEEQMGKLLAASHQDDLFEMLDRGSIRVAVTFNRTHYYLDHGKQFGLTYEVMSRFEDYLKGRYKSRLKGRSLSVLLVPVARDEMIPRLAEGYFDLAVANLTITEQRQKRVDFSIPTIRNTAEVVVASSRLPQLETLDELSGKTVMVRQSSSFFEHLQKLNARLLAAHQLPVRVIPADEFLETEDLIEMVNADLVDYTVADLHIARLWEQVFPDIRVNQQLKIAEGTNIAWAMRKDTPNLRFEVNRFLRRHRPGTVFGNVLKERYLENPERVRNALSQEDRDRFRQLADLFKRYADQYGFDHLMLLAQGYQESGLDNSKRSPVGAVGIMQVMPATGKAMQVGDIRELENNVHAGSKYLRVLIDRYFNDAEVDEFNRFMFAFAAYNAGPTRIRKLRRKTERMGLDPNTWFGNVEHAVAREIGRETVNYVANISKYYLAYRLAEEKQREKLQRDSESG